MDKHDPVPTILVHSCPVCGEAPIINRIDKNGGWNEAYENWLFICRHCSMVSVELPADNYYDREYFKTIDDAVLRWNEMCCKYEKNKGG